MTFSRFYLCDLQVHTPADVNHRYGNVGGREPNREFARSLIKAYADAGVQVIAVTDHNCIDWYPVLAEEGEKVGLAVFPGLEISVNGCHLLIIWDRTDVGLDKANLFLNQRRAEEADLFNSNGEPKPLSRGSVIDIAEEAIRLGGLVFAPHSTAKDSGLFARKVIRNSKEVASSGLITGFDVYGNPKADVLTNPTSQFGDILPRWFITGDTRSFQDVGKRAVYLKLGAEPTLEGIRQAFIAAETRIRFPTWLQNDWGHVKGVRFLDSPTPSWPRINKVEITGGFHDGLSVTFGPGLNAIIGGRGTGKSTLIEIIRYALEAGDPAMELQENRKANFPRNANASISFSTADGEDYTIVRSGDETAAKLLRHGEETGVMVERRARVRVFGQRELLAFARRPDRLREFVAIHCGEEWRTVTTELRELFHQLQQVSDQLNQAEERRAKLEDLEAERADLREKLARVEEHGVEALLQDLSLLATLDRQVADAVNWPAQLREAFGVVKERLTAPDLEEDPALGSMRAILADLAESLSALLTSAESQVTEAEQQLREGDERWKRESFKRRGEIGERLAAAGVSNLDEVHSYQERVVEVEHLIADVTGARRELETLEQERGGLLERIRDLQRQRSQLVESTAQRLNEAVGDRVRIQVQPLADNSAVLEALKDAVRGKNVRDDQLEQLARHGPSGIAEALRKGADAIRALGCTPSTAQKLAKLSPAEIRKIESSPVEDLVTVEINVGSSTSEIWTPIHRASPGQQATAMLALVLSSGSEPLIIDQPEDDLDNRYIFHEVVKVLTRVCEGRQVIVATHNANIPVLGDAELILALDADVDRSKVLACGGLEQPEVAEHARHILEGGDEAFKTRHSRYIGVRS